MYSLRLIYYALLVTRWDDNTSRICSIFKSGGLLGCGWSNPAVVGGERLRVKFSHEMVVAVGGFVIAEGVCQGLIVRHVSNIFFSDRLHALLFV